MALRRRDLAGIKGILEPSSFIPRLPGLTTEHPSRCAHANAKRIIYRPRSNNFRLLISDEDNVGRRAVRPLPLPPLFPLSPSAVLFGKYNCNRDCNRSAPENFGGGGCNLPRQEERDEPSARGFVKRPTTVSYHQN